MEIVVRVRSMTRRYTEYETSVRQYEDITLNPTDFSLTSRNAVRLSIKEFELMQILMLNADVELSTQALLDRIWKTEPDAHQDTVWLYVSYLKGKLFSIGSCLTISGTNGGSYRLIKQID